MPLSDREIKELLEMADAYFHKNEHDKALECYNRLIENAPGHPYYFSQRAWIRHSDNLTLAIDDLSRAIELAPDDAQYYKRRGELIFDDICTIGKPTSDEFKTHVYKIDFLSDSRVKKVLADFKAAIERDPTEVDLWLNLMKVNILLLDFDEAITICGSCRPYIKRKEDNLIRSWLGCLALIFAGDSLEDGDKKPLYDLTIHIPTFALCGGLEEISAFIMELRKQNNYIEKCKKAIEIQKLLINHFGDALYANGRYFLQLECYGEALKVYDDELERHPTDIFSLGKKIVILGRLKRYEDMVKCVDNEEVIKILDRPDWDEEALNLLEKSAPQLKLSISQAWFAKGRCLYNHSGNKYGDAFKALDKAIELNPDMFWAWYERARRFAIKGVKTNALKDISMAIKLDSKAKEFAQKDEEFQGLWDDGEFKRIVAQT